jgi:hypothetical protein
LKFWNRDSRAKYISWGWWQIETGFTGFSRFQDGIDWEILGLCLSVKALCTEENETQGAKFEE